MGIPVICNDIGDTGHIIKRTGTGILVPSFDDDSMKVAVESICSLAAIDRQAIRKHALDFFDLHTGSQKYAQLYHRILRTEKKSVITAHA
jgi:glycosyltransferase involved in cell wall biosynthesis